MRIIINGRFLSQPTTGVQRMAREFIRALDRLLLEDRFPGLQVDLLVQPDICVADLGLRAVRARSVGFAGGHFWEQAVLPWYARGGWLLNLGNTAPLLNLWNADPVAVVVHDVSYQVVPDAYRPLYRMAHLILGHAIMKRARLILTVSESERDTIAELYPHAASRIRVAQNGGAPDDIAPRLCEPSPEAYGLYVGSLSRRKNIDIVLDTAIRLARERGLRFKIVAARSPILHDTRLTLPEDVRHLIDFCGQVESVTELASLYRGASFLLFPSAYEASALPPIEAMSYGCPVIASDIEALQERCGNAAIYCSAHDLEQIRAAALRLLDDRPFRDDLIRRGLAWATRYTWREQATAVITEMLPVLAP